MTRKTLVSAATAGLLLTALTVPAAASPLVSAPEDDGRTTVCLGLNSDPDTTEREGICVWVPVEP